MRASLFLSLGRKEADLLKGLGRARAVPRRRFGGKEKTSDTEELRTRQFSLPRKRDGIYASVDRRRRRAIRKNEELDSSLSLSLGRDVCDLERERARSFKSSIIHTFIYTPLATPARFRARERERGRERKSEVSDEELSEVTGGYAQ